MNKFSISVLALLLSLTSSFAFIDFNEINYQKAIKGDAEWADKYCNWFSLFTDGEVFDKKGKKLDTSPSTVQMFCTIGAKGGYKGSQKQLGYNLVQANTKESKNEALLWLEKAAIQGEKDAAALLGELYSTHQEVKRDYEKSFYWYSKASDAGDALSKCQLGFLYATGQGTLKDVSKARALLQEGYQKAEQPLLKQYCSKMWSQLGFDR